MTRVLVRGGEVFSISPWPKGIPNPGKHQFTVSRNGWPVGGARTIDEAVGRINRGFYDQKS